MVANFLSSSDLHVSVIILNYNGKKFLKNCFSSLNLTDYPRECFETIMVDNGSTDDSVEYVKTNFPWVRILPLAKNYGYTGGNNRGASCARGELLVFLNNDTTVEKNWLKQLAKVMNIDRRIAICGSKIMSMTKPHKAQFAGGFLNLLGSAIFSSFDKDNSSKDFYYTGSICGASFMARRSVFENLSGFDEDFFMYSDENDFCLRVWLSGYLVAYIPSSVVYHFGNAEESGFSSDTNAGLLNARLLSSLTIYHGNKNSLCSILKNFCLVNIVSGSFMSIVYFIVQLILLLKAKNLIGTRLLLAAFLWPLRNLSMILKKRYRIQTKRIVSDQYLIKNGILLSAGGLVKMFMSNLIRNDHNS
jgi:hypothetical protein